MKWVVVKIIQTFNKMYDWLKQKDRLGNQRSASILMVTFFAFGVVAFFKKNSEVTKVVAYLFVLLLFAMISIFRFDVSDNIISKLTKDACSTPRELLKKLSHISYAYGLFWFSLETCFFVEIFIFLITEMINNKPSVVDIMVLWICCMFVYTFFYFAYHIYFADSKERVEVVKQRIQLYAAIGTTISFLMLLFGESREFKIFIVGTMLEYTWLQYFITKELNTIKDN